MNNLVTLWDPISGKIRNYEILSQCSCWINQYCYSIEILLSPRAENDSVRRAAGYCHHFNHDVSICIQSFFLIFPLFLLYVIQARIYAFRSPWLWYSPQLYWAVRHTPVFPLLSHSSGVRQTKQYNLRGKA